MTEEIKTPEETETPTEKPKSLLEGAHEAAERLKAENDRMEANIRKIEEIKAFETLSGQSDNPEPQKKDKAQELADEITKAFK